MSVNYQLADKMAGVGDVKRQDMKMTGAFSRSAALADTGEEQKPETGKGNVVQAEMKQQEAEREMRAVFDEVSDACYAAREACQKEQEGVQSKKERDAILVKCLNDLIAVIEQTRDGRQDIMSAIADKENPDAPEALRA